MDVIDIDEIGIKEKMKNEIERFKKFQRIFLGKSIQVTVADVDIRNYSKYLLKEGKDIEKRELLGCLKGQILLQHKTISLK